MPKQKTIKKPIKKVVKQVEKEPKGKIKGKVEEPKVETTVEPKILAPELPEVPTQYFGVNAIEILLIENTFVRDKLMQKVSLRDGTTIVLSQEELEIRLNEGLK